MKKKPNKLKEKYNPALSSSSDNLKIRDELKDKYKLNDEKSTIELIEDNLLANKTFKKIQLKLKIRPIYILLILLVPLIILLLLHFSLTSKIITTLYPLYKSFKALNSRLLKFKKDEEDKIIIQWLSYWLLYAFVDNCEIILGSLITKIYLYPLLKFIFLFLCFVPQIQLNVLIYDYFTGQLYKLYGESFENWSKSLLKKIFSGDDNDKDNLDNNIDDNI